MKQSSRIKLLFSVFLITGLIAGMVLVKNSNWTTDESSKLSLSVDSTSLSKIIIVSDSQTTILIKGKNDWMVNDKYIARPNLIQLLFVGLLKSELKRPIAAENKQKTITYLQQKGIRVNTIDALQTNSFLIATNDNDANSSYFMAEGTNEPYIIYVPGFSGDMANIFKMDEANWRSKVLFASTPLSLQKIAVSYPSFSQNNVVLKWNTDKSFNVQGIQNIDSSKVITYLSQFEQVLIDQYIYKNKEFIINSLNKNKPQAIIEVTDLSTENSHKLKIYGESRDPKGIYAIIEPENEVVIMKPETLFRLLVRKEFFEKKK